MISNVAWVFLDDVCVPTAMFLGDGMNVGTTRLSCRWIWTINQSMSKQWIPADWILNYIELMWHYLVFGTFCQSMTLWVQHFPIMQALLTLSVLQAWFSRGLHLPCGVSWWQSWKQRSCPRISRWLLPKIVANRTASRGRPAEVSDFDAGTWICSSFARILVGYLAFGCSFEGVINGSTPVTVRTEWRYILMLFCRKLCDRLRDVHRGLGAPRAMWWCWNWWSAWLLRQILPSEWQQWMNLGAHDWSF